MLAFLLVRAGRRSWVERSGGTLRIVARLRATFPEARFLHVVRDGLEDAHQERSVLVGGDLDLAGLVGGFRRRLVGGGGEVADDRVEQAAQADPLERAADQDGGQDRFLDALAQAASSSGSEISSPQYGQDLVVAWAAASQLVAPWATSL
jgi:hypothetical protein